MQWSFLITQLPPPFALSSSEGNQIERSQCQKNDLRLFIYFITQNLILAWGVRLLTTLTSRLWLPICYFSWCSHHRDISRSLSLSLSLRPIRLMKDECAVFKEPVLTSHFCLRSWWKIRRTRWKEVPKW